MTVRSAPAAATVVAPLAIGVTVAVALGVYGSIHDPTGRSFAVLGFESVSAWKSGLASAVVVLFVAQLGLALRFNDAATEDHPVPSWAMDTRRILGTLSFGLSLPVVFHCLWALGFRSDDTRLLVHSLAGCVAYGVYVANVTGDQQQRGPWGSAQLGAALGIALMAAWWSSAAFHFSSVVVGVQL